jgi:hypothetical protein
VIAHIVDFEWATDKQPKLKTLRGRYPSWGTSGAWRVPRRRLASFSLVLGDTEDWNDVSGQWYTEWPLDTWVDSPILRWLRDTILPMLFNKRAEYPKPDEEDVSNGALLYEAERNYSALSRVPPPQNAVLFCPLPGQVHQLKWWLTKCFADHLDIFYMYAEMDNDERTEMQLQLQDCPNPAVFVTTRKVSGTGLNLTAANHTVIPQKSSVLNEQGQAFAQVV